MGLPTSRENRLTRNFSKPAVRATSVKFERRIAPCLDSPRLVSTAALGDLRLRSCEVDCI